jgi:hypothetical protein
VVRAAAVMAVASATVGERVYHHATDFGRQMPQAARGVDITVSRMEKSPVRPLSLNLMCVKQIALRSPSWSSRFACDLVGEPAGQEGPNGRLGFCGGFAASLAKCKYRSDNNTG